MGITPIMDFAKEHYGANADDFLAAFPASTDEQSVRSADDFTTDGFIATGAWRWAEAQSKTGQAPVYRYRFDRPAPSDPLHPAGKYAFHSTELEYVFGTLDSKPRDYQREDRALSEHLGDYWVNFARTGDPNGDTLPSWPAYGRDKIVHHLDAVLSSRPLASRARLELLDEIYESGMPAQDG